MGEPRKEAARPVPGGNLGTESETRVEGGDIPMGERKGRRGVKARKWDRSEHGVRSTRRDTRQFASRSKWGALRNLSDQSGPWDANSNQGTHLRCLASWLAAAGPS